MDDWRVPTLPTHINLDRDELLCLDWHLSGHYLTGHYLSGISQDIREIINTWHDFRVLIWTGIKTLGNLPGDYPLAMDESTARYLFNWLPPTFMWGTGRDCGFSLKMKLRGFLIGEEVALDDKNAAESGPKDPPFTYA